jgi:hypothetical protein
MNEQQQKLVKVREEVLRLLQTILDNIRNFPQLREAVTEFIPHIRSQLIPMVTVNTRSTVAVQNGLEGIIRWLEILRDTLSELSPDKAYLGYYWIGKCVAVLADIMLLIDIALEKTKEGE